MRHEHPKKPQVKTGLSSQRDVDNAWEKFLCTGGHAEDLPIRDIIANSWERCLSQGVNPEQQTAPLVAFEDTLHALQYKNSDLIDCARPVLEQARVFLHDLETILFLTDYQGLNLEIVGDQRTLYDANGIGLVPGSGWNEVVSGSNAV
ncbi:MAG: hypothetical protein V7722_00680, partial [Porticoccus sp.]